MLTSPLRNLTSVIMSPNDISSAMSLAIRSAWLIATSTPISDVNSQAFLGLLTRAMTRWMPNSNRAMVDTTKLFSSSPVTAATTWAVLMPTSLNT